MTSSEGFPWRGAPKDDESFLGYLLRVTESNGYETQAWVRQISGMTRIAKGNAFIFENNFDLKPFSLLTGVPEGKLSNLLYHTTLGEIDPNRQVTHRITTIPQHLIELARPKLCPRCLSEMGYAQRAWDITAVTVCQRHECLLLSKCPGCGKRISWKRRILFSCACGYDFRKAPVPAVSKNDLRLTMLIHRRCGLLSADESITRERRSNPLYDLGLEDIILAVAFVARQKTAITRSGHGIPFSLSNEAQHETLKEAFGFFDEWPDGLTRFLDQIRDQGYGTSVIASGVKFYSKFVMGMRSLWDTDGGKLIREAFENYLVTRWDGRLLPLKSNIKFPNAIKYNQYVGAVKAAETLNVSIISIKRFIENGHLKGSFRVTSGKRKVFRIEKTSLDELRNRISQSLSRSQVAEILGISVHGLSDLVENECIRLFLKNGNRHFYEQKEVNNFLSRISALVDPLEPSADSKLVGLLEALRSFSWLKIGVGRLFREVLDGNIKPRTETEGTGLSRFKFDKVELSSYRRAQLRPRGFLFIKGVAKRLDMKEENVIALVRMGILKTSNDSVDPQFQKRGKLIHEKAIEEFEATYVSLVGLARKYKTSPKCLLKLLSIKGVKTVLGRKDHRFIRYLYRRSDLAGINFAELDLVSACQATRILGLDRSTFEHRWVRTGLLDPVVSDDTHQGKFFLRKNILKIAKLTKKFVSGSEAAKILGIHQTNIGKLCKNKKLKTATGPYAQVYKTPRYLKEDVEKLAKERMHYAS